MKTKIKNLISTIERNENHHCEVFSLKNDQRIRVSVNESYSLDGRGLLGGAYYEILIQPTSPTFYGKPYSYFGGKNHIKRILKQWLDGKIELSPCGWAGYAQPAYMFKNK